MTSSLSLLLTWEEARPEMFLMTPPLLTCEEACKEMFLLTPLLAKS